MFSLRTLSIVIVLAFSLATGNAHSQDQPLHHSVVLLNKFAPGQWVEKVWGDPRKPGEPFVIRIHNDAGYLVLPHYHLIDENITVVEGSWALGTGKRFDKSGLEPMEVGTLASHPGICPTLPSRGQKPLCRYMASDRFRRCWSIPCTSYRQGYLRADIFASARNSHLVKSGGLLRSESWRSCARRTRRRHGGRRAMLTCQSDHRILGAKI